MRIAYVSNGVSVHDYRFLHKMVERGHEPYLISYWSGKVDFVMDGVKFIHHDPRPPRLPQIVLHLRSLLREIQPDILHTGWVQTNGLYGALSGFHPLLLMPWGSDVLILPDESWWKGIVTRYVIRKADMITCDCQLVKDKIVTLANYPSEKIITFPWGIDLGIFKPANASSMRERLGWEDKKILIMTRYFTKRVYGIEYFIEALPSVIREVPEARAVLVGSGYLEGHYRRQVRKLGLTDHVYFAGGVNEMKMAELLNNADIYVTTSLSDGASCSLLEAMACGLPVVVSDAPVYFEWVEDAVNGFIVPRRNTARLAERLIELLNDSSLPRSMGERNLQIAREGADWDANFSKLENMYSLLALE